MPNQLSISQAIKRIKPQTGLETKLNQNQEINKLVVEIQGKQVVNTENWVASGNLCITPI